MIRLLTLPDTHPLHSIIESIRNDPPKRHPSPLADLIKIFKLRRKKLETILPVAQCPQIKTKFATEIAGLREESIAQEKNDEAEYKVFSDGSGMEDGVGTAAILYKKGQSTPVDKLKAFLGPPSRRNTFEAEAIGAILAAKLLSDHPDTIGKAATLYIDNQSIIASLKTPKVSPGQHLVRHLLLSVNALACNLKIWWISSHSKVKGNEKVDELAKEAAEGRSSEVARLLHILRTPLPISASATKQAYLKRLKYAWEDEWEESDRGRRFNSIDEHFPFNSYRKHANCLTRSQAMLTALPDLKPVS